MARYPGLDQLAINTVRLLTVDSVQKAKSGHPGTPIDAAPAADAATLDDIRTFRRGGSLADFGFTTDAVVAATRQALGARPHEPTRSLRR
jgi:hypothetical protein